MANRRDPDRPATARSDDPTESADVDETRGPTERNDARDGDVRTALVEWAERALGAAVMGAVAVVGIRALSGGDPVESALLGAAAGVGVATSYAFFVAVRGR